MLGLKLNHVSKRGQRYVFSPKMGEIWFIHNDINGQWCYNLSLSDVLWCTTVIVITNVYRNVPNGRKYSCDGWKLGNDNNDCQNLNFDMLICVSINWIQTILVILFVGPVFKRTELMYSISDFIFWLTKGKLLRCHMQFVINQFLFISYVKWTYPYYHVAHGTPSSACDRILDNGLIQTIVLFWRKVIFE